MTIDQLNAQNEVIELQLQALEPHVSLLKAWKIRNYAEIGNQLTEMNLENNPECTLCMGECR